MTTYFFETITPAQALEYNVLHDTLDFGNPASSGPKMTVLFNPATGTSGATVTLIDNTDGHSVTFGTGIYGEGDSEMGSAAGFPDGSNLIIGAPLFDDGPATATGTADGMFGGSGDDTLSGWAGNDLIQGNQGNDSLSGGATLSSTDNGGNDTIYGGQGNDFIDVGGGSNIAQGNRGNDTITAAHGNTADSASTNILLGGQGDDSIVGGSGNDYISGDLGNDTETGGGGADQFHSFVGAGIDRVLDFNLAEGDQVRLDPGTAFTVAQVGADTVVNIGTGGGQVILVGVQMSTLHGNWIFTG